jgi:hypothetical protein
MHSNLEYWHSLKLSHATRVKVFQVFSASWMVYHSILEFVVCGFLFL